MKQWIYTLIFVFASINAFAKSDFTIYEKPLDAKSSMFYDQYNSALNIASLKGKVIILNFWATWCTPCIVEMPSLNMLQKKYAKSLKTIPLISSNESVSKVRSFLRRYKLTDLPYYVDEGSFTAQSYGVVSIPTSIIFNKKGQIAAMVEGSIDWLAPNNIQYIEKLIAE